MNVTSHSAWGWLLLGQAGWAMQSPPQSRQHHLIYPGLQPEKKDRRRLLSVLPLSPLPASAGLWHLALDWDLQLCTALISTFTLKLMTPTAHLASNLHRADEGRPRPPVCSEPISYNNYIYQCVSFTVFIQTHIIHYTCPPLTHAHACAHTHRCSLCVSMHCMNTTYIYHKHTHILYTLTTHAHILYTLTTRIHKYHSHPTCTHTCCVCSDYCNIKLAYIYSLIFSKGYIPREIWLKSRFHMFHSLMCPFKAES